MSTGRLAGKVAIVTGAARGIGQGIAVRFAREGARVALLDIDPEGCEQTKAIIDSIDGEAISVACDVTDVTAVERSVGSVRDRLGDPDILVNNAAVMPSGALHETTPADFDRCLAVNLRGTYALCRAVLPRMLERGKGSIIHMASVTGLLGLPGLAAYSATKGALISLTRAMSTDYAGHGIRVNSVAPGTIDSPMLHAFLAQQSDPERLREEFDAVHPIGRVGTIEEVASVFTFLASDEASFVTGATYTVDGGSSVRGQQPQD